MAAPAAATALSALAALAAGPTPDGSAHLCGCTRLAPLRLRRLLVQYAVEHLWRTHA